MAGLSELAQLNYLREQERRASAKQAIAAEEERKKRRAGVAQQVSEMGFQINAQKAAQEQAALERAQAQKELGLRQREMDQQYDIDRAGLKLRQQVAREEAERARMFGTDDAKRRWSELKFRQSQPNDIDVLRERASIEQAGKGVDMAVDLLKSARGMKLDEEGKSKLADLSSQFRKIQESRSRLDPKQYDELVQKWMGKFDDARLDQFKMPEMTAQERLNSQLATLADGTPVFIGEDGKPQVLKTGGGTGTTVKATGADPKEMFTEIMSDPDKKQTAIDDAVERLNNQWYEKNPDAEGDPPTWNDGQIGHEIRRGLEGAVARDQALMSAWKPLEPENLSSQGQNTGRELRELQRVLQEHPELRNQSSREELTPSPGGYPVISPESKANVQMLSQAQRKMAEAVLPKVFTDEEYDALSPGRFIDGETGDLLVKPARPDDPMSRPSPSDAPPIKREKKLDFALNTLANIVGSKPSKLSQDPGALRDAIRKGFSQIGKLTQKERLELVELLKRLPELDAEDADLARQSTTR